MVIKQPRPPITTKVRTRLPTWINRAVLKEVIHLITNRDTMTTRPTKGTMGTINKTLHTITQVTRETLRTITQDTRETVGTITQITRETLGTITQVTRETVSTITQVTRETVGTITPLTSSMGTRRFKTPPDRPATIQTSNSTRMTRIRGHTTRGRT